METVAEATRRSTLADYVSIARPDHWLKNIFMLPGAALAFIIDKDTTREDLGYLLLGILATCLIASANYTINEYLDGKFDRFHPTKHKRATAQGRIKLHWVVVQYLALVVGGLSLALQMTPMFFYASCALLFMGLVYNVEPVRTKDRVYLDVLSESVNNPLRLILGWAAVTTIILPPSSLLISYWMGGAYLMAIKRYAEYRMIGDPERAGLYRRSFRTYTENSLMVSAFFYALTCVFFLAIFLIKYRIEFILTFPFFALLFAWYERISLRPKSSAINPERMYLEPHFMGYVVFLITLVAVLFVVDIPALNFLTEHTVVRDRRLF
jgi:4-hydroxybenzoate polyprenyltransferase